MTPLTFGLIWMVGFVVAIGVITLVNIRNNKK